MARVLLCSLNRPSYLDEDTVYYNHHESQIISAAIFKTCFS
jgi:hypothetical protein